MQKQCFLLNQAQEVATDIHNTWIYDHDLHMNVSKVENGSIIPLCSSTSIMTNSKTDAAPGDDDPDAEAELCY